MTLTESKCSSTSVCNGQTYQGAGYVTQSTFLYGYFAWNTKVIGNAGSWVMLHAGNQDPHDDIILEFMGDAQTQMHVYFWKAGVWQEGAYIDLGFTFTQAFHTYAFNWTAQSVSVFVDSTLVWTTTNTAIIPTTPVWIGEQILASQTSPGPATSQVKLNSISYRGNTGKPQALHPCIVGTPPS